MIVHSNLETMSCHVSGCSSKVGQEEARKQQQIDL